MIPATYTRETFADYLQFEVLYETANDLGWTSYLAPTSPYAYPEDFITVGITDMRVGDAFIVFADTPSSATHDIMPSLYDIPSGTKMTLSVGGAIKETLGDIAIGDDSATFTTAFALINIGDKGLFFNSLIGLREQHPQYNAIIDEILLKLNADDIESISDIRKLRLFGRREAWAAVMQTTSSYYDYATINGAVNRSNIYESARTNFEMEDQRVRSLYTEQPVDRSGLIALSGQHKVVARW